MIYLYPYDFYSYHRFVATDISASSSSVVDLQRELLVDSHLPLDGVNPSTRAPPAISGHLAWQHFAQPLAQDFILPAVVTCIAHAQYCTQIRKKR